MHSKTVFLIVLNQLRKGEKTTELCSKIIHGHFSTALAQLLSGELVHSNA
jgi:hypothetical protein